MCAAQTEGSQRALHVRAEIAERRRVNAEVRVWLGGGGPGGWW
jgi:hypothetical protein